MSMLKTILRSNTSLEQRWIERVGVGALVAPLMGAATFLISSAALATPVGGVAEAMAKLDKEIAEMITLVDSTSLDAVDDQSSAALSNDMAGLDSQITRILNVAMQASQLAGIPNNWNPEGANACKQVDGTVVLANGTAVCTTNSDGDDQAVAKAQGDGASATANAIHDGRANAKALGDASAATARSGDAARTGQARNAADASSLNGSTATANAGVGDFDEDNEAKAVAEDGSLSIADAGTGDKNQDFALSVNNGEARATNRAGDRNVAVAIGANGNNDGNGPLGARATTLIGNDNTALSVADGLNSAATTNAGYGDRHKAAAAAGPNSDARADSAQGEESESFATATDRGHALAFNSYGDHMRAIATSKGDGSTGRCAVIGQPVNSGQTTYPPDACSTANARAVDGDANTAISVVDKAKAYSVAERGTHNIAVTRAANGGDIIWNTTPSLPSQPPNPHAGLTPDCPWPLPPLPQAQQACGNATAKASYGDGNVAVAAPNGDHSFAWSEASGGGYNETLATAEGANSRARARGIYNNHGTAKATAADGGRSEAATILGYENVSMANATGAGSVANATAAGPHAQATAAASSGGTATAVHNTTNIAAFITGPLVTGVTCSPAAVTYALIGTGQSCGTGF